MSEDRRKINKHSTGTVPKAKYRNNTSYSSLNEREGPQSVTNNLATEWHHSDYSNFIRNPRRNLRNNYFQMDTTVDDFIVQSTQDCSGNVKLNSNDTTTTSNTSSSTSRRNSGQVLKCDNVAKYPDKKQIEEKLKQIREYLRITSSLMSSMKNTDEQYDDQVERDNLMKMVKDLKDSEAKLVVMLGEINESDQKNNEIQLLENGESEEPVLARRNDADVNLSDASSDAELLREHQRMLLRLQQKAENKLRDARQIQDKLLMAACDNDVHYVTNSKLKNCSEHDFDAAIKELEERAKRLNEQRPSNANVNIQEKILEQVEGLHNEILNLRSANDERSHLIEILDNRDTQLRTHQLELQNKLHELQSKKTKVDQLVAQLQDINEPEDEDEVRNIVNMKGQLKKLKEMLDIVKTTENIINTNGSTNQEMDGSSCEMCTTENFLQKDLQKTRPQQNDSNVMYRYDNNTGMNENRYKQMNKNSRDQFNDTKYQKSALQAELAAKKKELEDLMGKHKAGTSNLNHDVGMDTKSEFSSSTNINNENIGSYWVPIATSSNRPDSSDRFSSDECQEDINEYTEINENLNALPLPSLNYSLSNTTKQRIDNHPRVEYAPSVDYERLQSIPRTPERNVRSSSVATSGYVRERSVSNNEQDNRVQVQKQLQLIKNVCESMIEQQSSGLNSQQLRNNLTPSPLYSEPRQFASPNPHPLNALNVVNTNPCTDVPWFNANNTSVPNDFSNYQGWLATNTLQTQSFMLNTLNQCCQMLWLQQRELASLRNTVSMLQERVDGVPYDNSNNITPATTTPNLFPNQYRPTQPNQKINQVSAACSMPNLNHYNVSSSNLEPTYTSNHHNNIQSGRLLDPSLNNINHSHINVQQHHQQNGEHSNNQVLHGVNTNQNLPGQLWNGQALNNQVPPGNRANNYWDNFRSYSRQNLLSTKNNDGFQNLPSSLDRSNASSTTDRPIPFTIMSLSKSNSEQESTRTSQENTPQRCAPIRPPRHMENFSTTSAIPPPDVLNVNHNITKVNEPQQIDLSSPSLNAQQNNDDLNLGFQMLFNAYNDTGSTHSNISEEQIFKDCIPEQCRRRNEWNNDVVVEESIPKTKLFDELRENVYKEVASLISANEARPHFLIQLFRDLQMIGSDSLRLKILQSIQTVITHSLLNTSQGCNRPASKSQNQASNEIEPTVPPPVTSNGFSMQSTVWSKPFKNKTSHRNLITIENESSVDIQNPLKEIIPFLNDHEGEIFQHNLKITLKQMLLESDSFKDIVKDSVFQKHVSNVLDEVLDQYHGTKLHDVKMHLIQSLNDLFRGEISFIQLIQETTPDCNPTNSSSLQVNDGNTVTHIQNGDLAEADQSRGGETENEEEEGAVGGFLDVPPEITVKTDHKDNSEDVDLPTIDFPSNAEGLDQVPTRLPTKIKSRSTTPNKDRSNSRQDSTEPF